MSITSVPDPLLLASDDPWGDLGRRVVTGAALASPGGLALVGRSAHEWFVTSW